MKHSNIWKIIVCALRLLTQKTANSVQWHLFAADRPEDWMADVDARVDQAVSVGKEAGFIKAGDPVVVVTGWRKGAGFTNTMRLVFVE